MVGHLLLAMGRAMPPEDFGRKVLLDASGTPHAGISKYPVIITSVKRARLRQFITEARAHGGLLLHDYPEEMLTTAHDDELAAALAAKPEAGLVYLGAAVHGDAEALAPLSGKFMLYGKAA